MPVLQFVPFSSSPSPAFFHALARHKLDTQRLDDSVVSISARYAEARLIVDKAAPAAKEGDSPSQIILPGVVELDADSLTDSQGCVDRASDRGEISRCGAGRLLTRCDSRRTWSPRLTTQASSSSTGSQTVRLRGLLKNFNTIEEFKDASKPELLQPLVDSLAATLSPGSDESSAPELSPFLLLTFADLKKFRFFYWIAFPGIVQKPAWEVAEAGWVEAVEPEEERALRDAIESRCTQTNDEIEGAYLLRTSESGTPILASLREFRTFFDGLPDDEVKSIQGQLNALRSARLTPFRLLNRSERWSSTTPHHCPSTPDGRCATPSRIWLLDSTSSASRWSQCAVGRLAVADERPFTSPPLSSRAPSRRSAGSGTRRVSSDPRWLTCRRQWIPSGEAGSITTRRR